MPKPLNGWRHILAERVSGGVSVWYEGDDLKSFYRPDTVGHDKWAALADEQMAERQPKKDVA
jgi:hypothetical protein